MRIARAPHNWRVSPRQAIAIQNRLAPQINRTGAATDYRLICGVDATFSLDGEDCLAAVVLWDKKSNQVVEQHTARAKLYFPYIPGLLSFREAPAICKALRKLSIIPELLLCDGQGIAHQRRLGIASHLGLLANLPSIGCGKTRLIGRHNPVGLQKGDCVKLIHKKECVGTVLRTRDKVKPLFISIGHNISLAHGVKTVLGCCLKYRLPEPIRLAHQLASLARNSDKSLAHQ